MDEAEFQNVITFEHSNMKHFFLLPLLKSQNLSLPFAFDSGSKLILRVKKKKTKNETRGNYKCNNVIQFSRFLKSFSSPVSTKNMSVFLSKKTIYVDEKERKMCFERLTVMI